LLARNPKCPSRPPPPPLAPHFPSLFRREKPTHTSLQFLSTRDPMSAPRALTGDDFNPDSVSSDPSTADPLSTTKSAGAPPPFSSYGDSHSHTLLPPLCVLAHSSPSHHSLLPIGARPPCLYPRSTHAACHHRLSHSSSTVLVGEPLSHSYCLVPLCSRRRSRATGAAMPPPVVVPCRWHGPTKRARLTR
jgi:hypothetical protein